MKVGTHANEPLADIIARKSKEIKDAGYAMWGYGGNTCHPSTMVQRFAKSFRIEGQSIYLCMEEMESNHFAKQIRAEEFSVDGVEWNDIPLSINVLGSRYALTIRDLKQSDFPLALDCSEVAIGRSQGRSGHQYIQGRVDKACLVVNKEASEGQRDNQKHISLVAELVEPYAVFLRNHPSSE